MNTQQLIAPVFVALVTALPVLSAHADSGVYVGGGIGKAELKDSTGNPGGVDFTERDTAWKGFVGYYFDAIPLLRLGAEAGYRDLGSPDKSVGGVPVQYKAHGLDYAVLAGLGLGPVDLMARVGGMNYKLEKNVGGIHNDYDGNAPVYGVGLWFSVAGLGVRAEYEKIDMKELDDAQMVSVSLFYRF